MDALQQPLSSRSPSALTNDDIEAVIQMATSSRVSPDGRQGPLRDTRTQLFVGNLPYRVRWQDLKDLFRRAGTVLRADVSLGPDNRSRGYGTVLLATAEDAGRAIDLFNGYSWQTRILEVRPDRLPPDYDANHPPAIVTTSTSASIHAPKSSEELDYSTILDLHHNFPNAVNTSLRSLFVGNLPFHCQWQDLKDLFRQAGTIMRADVALGQDGRSRGFGTVTFATEIDADRAVKMFNGYEYNGRMLKVNHDKFAQLAQPNALSAVATPSSSVSPVSVSPVPSSRSAPDPRMALPSAYQARQLSSIGQPGKLPIGYQLGLGGSASSSPSPYDSWGAQQQQEIAAQKLQDERERELLRSFQNLDIGTSRASSTLSNLSIHAPTASRSTSNSSSTKPPSIVTTTSSGSLVSSTSTGAASSSTSNTSEKSDPSLPPSLARHRRLSSSQRPKNLTISSTTSPTVPTAASSATATANATPQAPTRHPSHRSPTSHHSHPHHPGPIALPPPPHATSFPLAHHAHGHNHNAPLHGLMGYSPLHHPLSSPSSPLFHHHAHPVSHHQQQVQQIQQQQQQMMTPHGLPPITPSMPSFNFLPPPPSPSTNSKNITGTNNPSQHHAAYSPYAHPLSSPLQMHTHMSMLMHGLPSPPLHAHQQQTHPAPFGITPLSPPNTGTAPTFASAASSSVSATTTNGTTTTATTTAYMPLTTFSPGVTMSPGAFWGRPGQGAPGPNPMINPTVGAPVHVVHVTPGHNHTHNPTQTHDYQGQAGGNMSPGYYGVGPEPTGYFDAGYFPPVYTLGGAEGGAEGAGLVGSRLVNEILKDKEEKERDRVRERERKEREKGSDEETKQEKSEGAEEAVDDKPLEDGLLGGALGPGSPGERVRRHSSTATTPWQMNPNDMRVWEGRERERERERGLVDLNRELALIGEGGGGAVISRTHSMSATKKPLKIRPSPESAAVDQVGAGGAAHREDGTGTGTEIGNGTGTEIGIGIGTGTEVERSVPSRQASVESASSVT